MATSIARWPKGLHEPDIAVLRAVVDASPSRVSLVTPDHLYLYANPEFLRFVGLPLDDLIGRSAADVLGPEVYAAFSKTASKVTPTNAPSWDGWITFSGGRKRYLEVTMAPYAPRGGAIEALFVFARDLTDLKAREQELAASLAERTRTESLHKAVVTSSLGCIIVMDEQGLVVEFNPAAERTFGWNRHEAIGQSIIDLIVPVSVRERHPSKLAAFQHLMNRDSMGTVLKREALTKDGIVITTEMSITRFQMDARDLFMVHCRDLSSDIVRQQELATSEAARQASEQINTQIVRTALDAFVLADAEGKIRDFNPAAEVMLGHRREDAIGELLSDMIIPHHHRAAHEAGMARYMATGVSRVMGKRMELEALSATGEIVPVEVTINEVKLPDQHLFTAHMRDLRDSKKAQAEIEAQRGRIHQIEKLSAMGSLLAGVAHELNNPLAILVAQSTLLKEKSPTDDVRQRAERIHAAAERAGRIVKSFLAMARQKPPAREMTNINQLIGETLEMLAYGLRTGGIETIREFDRTVPELKIDADMFRQVVANIVLNSQQVLLNAPAPRILTLRTISAPDHVAIEIGDNGPGVPAEIASRIFDPFFTTKPAGVGTGIGLAICKDIVQAHGGKLELVGGSKPGALFRVTIPRIDEEPDQVSDVWEEVSGERILVIDDEKDVGESLGEILEALGHRVVVTVSAHDGLQRIRNETFDRVFVDLRMPEMSGNDVLAELAAKNPALAARSILMTGDTVRGPAMLLGGSNSRVLEKPFSLDEIRAVMAER